MKQISYKGDIVIGDAKIGMIFRGDKSNNSARGCFERGTFRLGGIKQIIYRRGYNQRGDIIGGIKILEWIFRGD